MKTYEFRCDAKKIYGVESALGKVTLRVDCDVFPEAVIEIEVTRAQADALENPRATLITAILPSMPKELREIFITGMTPAEWDELFGGGPGSQETYAALGYCFE